MTYRIFRTNEEMCVFLARLRPLTMYILRDGILTEMLNRGAKGEGILVFKSTPFIGEVRVDYDWVVDRPLDVIRRTGTGRLYCDVKHREEILYNGHGIEEIGYGLMRVTYMTI
jgi:hypothetical protein